jgi:hypothetical protein
MHFLHLEKNKKEAAEYFVDIWDSDICWNVIFPFSGFQFFIILVSAGRHIGEKVLFRECQHTVNICSILYVLYYRVYGMMRINFYGTFLNEFS